MKITADDKIEIKYLFATGMSQVSISKIYGISRQYVSLILKGSGLTVGTRKTITTIDPNRRKAMTDRAHKLVREAVKAGFIKPLPCEVCGETNKIHAHHDDYRFPLSVRWLCRSHHHAWHGRNMAKP